MIGPDPGGTIGPSVPPAAQQPVASAGEKRRARISGRATGPIVAAVASEDPVSAPKPAQPPMVASASPPRYRLSSMWPSQYMSSAIPETAAKLPIMRNSGRVATWLLVRNVVASVANALMAGAKPGNKGDPKTQVRATDL